MERKSFLNSWQAKLIEAVIFLFLSWLWAYWWMGDVMCVAHERSFFAANTTLMWWLWQKSFGWLWIIGRALLTLYHWPLIGALFVAALLTIGSLLFGYCLRLHPLWRWLQWLPSAAWMMWTAHVGLNLYYFREPGRILAIPFLFFVVCAVIAALIFFIKRPKQNYYQDLTTDDDSKKKTAKKKKTAFAKGPWLAALVTLVVMAACFALPMYHLEHRHPYMRPLTHMQVQLMKGDYYGISRTAHEHPEMSYRQMAGYYVIALAHTGQLAEQLFDIKLDFDSVRAYGYNGKPNKCLNYHVIDCNYHAGLIRAARHYAVQDLTMDGPSLYILKILVKMALIDGDWELARKYIHVIDQAPFEGAFVRKYQPMTEHHELVQADPEFAFIMKNAPTFDNFEQMYLKPCFAGFFVDLRSFPNSEVETWSAVACLYSKRMQEFLKRRKPFLGTTPPRSIAEGLLTQVNKYPDIMQAFPQLEMFVEQYNYFLQLAAPYMNDREAGSKALFNQFKGYYPYYYFFGNLGSTRKPDEGDIEHNRAGVN